MAKIIMTKEKITKNTVKFNEVLASDTDAPAIGTLYVPKQTLKAMGWADGKNISVTVTVARSAVAPAEAPAEEPKTKVVAKRRGRPAKKTA